MIFALGALFIGVGIGLIYGYHFGRVHERTSAYEMARATTLQELARRGNSGDAEKILAKAAKKHNAALRAVIDAHRVLPSDDRHVRNCEANLRLAQQQLDEASHYALGDNVTS